jgi:large subunit ribosomal protein L18
MKIPKRRRREGKTDYKLRIGLLKSEKPRIVFRKTNRYVIGQCVKSKNAQDYTVLGVNSKDLLDYGWPAERTGSLKSLPACYLSGLLLGKKILKKEKEKEFIFDIGMLRHVYKSKIYAFLKGVKDAGVNVNAKAEVFPDEKRLKGEHTKVKEIFDRVKEKIEEEKS